MQPINGLMPTGPAAGLVARRAPPGGGFTLPSDTAARAPAGMAGADGIVETSLIDLLTLQEDAAGEEVRDRTARRRGVDLLAELASLQRDLLAGGVTDDRLERLEDLARDIPDAADPRLRDAVAAIALRARVEAARYGSR